MCGESSTEITSVSNLKLLAKVQKDSYKQNTLQLCKLAPIQFIFPYKENIDDANK